MILNKFELMQYLGAVVILGTHDEYNRILLHLYLWPIIHISNRCHTDRPQIRFMSSRHTKKGADV